MRHHDDVPSGPDEIFERTLSQIVRYLHCDAAVLYGLSAELNLLWPLARIGDVRDQIAPAIPGISFIGNALNAGRPAVATEAELADPGNPLRGERAKSAVALPFGAGGEAGGVLVALSHRAMEVTPEMLRALSLFATQFTTVLRRLPTWVASNIQRRHIEAITEVIGTAVREGIVDEDAMVATIARHTRLLTGAHIVAFSRGNRSFTFFDSAADSQTRRIVTIAPCARLRERARHHTVVRRKAPFGDLQLELLWRSRFTPTPAQLRMIDLIAHTLAAVNALCRRIALAAEEHRKQFLINVSKVLGHSLELSRVIEQIENLIVPEIADYVCVTHGYREVSDQHLSSAQSSSSSPAGFLNDVLRETSAIETAVSSGRAVHMRFNPPVAAGEIAEIAIEPMISDARVIGTISFGLTAAREPSTSADRALYGSLAGHAANALANAASFGKERDIANTLQTALLSTRLPVDDRIIFDAVYVPAGKHALVGGDWYDVFSLDKNRIAVSMGDVCGHGIRSSVTMNIVRLAIRAAALNGDDPVEVLRKGDRMLAAERDAPMVTAIYGVVDLTRNLFSYACAGHMPPYTLYNRKVEALATSGRPLGIGLDFSDDRQSFETAILPNTTIVLYTDGLVEYGRDLIAGEQRLREILQSIPEDASQRTLARDLHDKIFSNSESTQNDDVAILTMTLCAVEPSIHPAPQRTPEKVLS